MTLYAPITADEMRDAIQEMHTALPKYQLTPETMPQTIRVYREGLLPYDREAVFGGGKLLRRTADKFPSPASWRNAIHEWIRHNRITNTREEETQRDGEGRAIVCRTCRSVALTAWLARANGSEYFRLIAPCDPSRHANGDRITLYPDNFIEWADQSLDVPTLALGRGAHLLLPAST